MSAGAPASGGRAARGERLIGPEIWSVDLVAAGPALRELERRTPRLSDWDRQNAAAIADAGAAAQWLAAHAALRLLLERSLGGDWRGLAFVRDTGIRPHLRGAPVTFSLSHSAGLALIAIAPGGDIGIDVERLRTVRVREPRRGAIEAAGAALGRPLPQEGEARFLQAWVRLEAFAKAQGCGIGRLLTQLGIVGGREMSPAAMPARVAALRQEARAPGVHDLELGPQLYAAVALPAGEIAPQVRWLPPQLERLEALLD